MPEQQQQHQQLEQHHLAGQAARSKTKEAGLALEATLVHKVCLGTPNGLTVRAAISLGEALSRLRVGANHAGVLLTRLPDYQLSQKGISCKPMEAHTAQPDVLTSRQTR